MAQPLSTDSIDMLIGPDNDLVVDSDLHLVGGVDGVAQLCRVAVQMFAGEWFLDLDLGIRYWDSILGVDGDRARQVAAADLRATLSAVSGVLRVVSLDVKFDGATRTLTATWQVSTANGDTPLDTLSTLGPGA